MQGFSDQPNEFPSRDIEREIRRDGSSRSWDGVYTRFAGGQAIAPPFPEVRVTDPAKLAAFTAAYREVRSGARPLADLPDIRDAFVDARAWQMGFAPKPGASGREILTQMCAQCHDGEVDPSLGRARFDVTKLDSMSRGAKDGAIARLSLDARSPLKMPPTRFRSLSADETALAIEELRR